MHASQEGSVSLLTGSWIQGPQGTSVTKSSCGQDSICTLVDFFDSGYFMFNLSTSF